MPAPSPDLCLRIREDVQTLEYFLEEFERRRGDAIAAGQSERAADLDQYCVMLEDAINARASL